MKEPPILDMQNVCTIAEGLFHSLGEVLNETYTWDWDVVASKLGETITSGSFYSPADFIHVMTRKSKES